MPDRRTIQFIASTVAATLLVVLGGLAAWRTFSEWRLGRVVLSNDGAPLIVQVLAETTDEPIGEPIDLLKTTTLALPDGDYRLRVDGLGRLGRTYRLAVNRGETIGCEISLDEGRLLGGEWSLRYWTESRDKPREEPMPFALVSWALELTPGKSDIVEFTGKSLIRRDGVTGQAVWDVSNPRSPYDPGHDPGPWVRRIGPNRWELQFVEPAIDLDGDGISDVLLVVGNSHAFMAVSGKDGSMLWNFVAEHDGPGGAQPEGPVLPGPLRQASRQGSVIGRPAVGDVNGDGTPDLIATMVFQEFPAEVERRTGKKPTHMTPAFARRVVQAISGRTGRWIWSCALDPNFAAIKATFWDRPPVLVRGRRSSVLGILDDSRWIPLDPATGRPRPGPIDLGFAPVRPPQYADLDGDGEPEILALGPGQAARQQSLAVFSTATGRQLWSATVNAKYGSPFIGALAQEWPWLVELDGDGRPEVIIPDSGPLPPKSGFRGLQVLDGGSGRTRWARPMQPETKAEDGLHHILEAPDLDGDGSRDLIAISRFEGRNPPAPRTTAAWRDRRPEPVRIFVDALSGRDGRPLWSWHEDIPSDKVTHVWPPRWWGRGPDGWPMLAVPLGGQNPEQPGGLGRSSNFLPPAVHMLEASAGRETQRALGLQQIGVADLDGDGLDDLWGEADGQLRAFRGEPPEAWRALGQFVPAQTNSPWGGSIDRLAADLDGDGIADTLGGPFYTPGDSPSDPRGSRTAIARSGRDGRVLWRTALDLPWLWFLPEHARGYTLSTYPPPAGDLDGDGTPDVLAHKSTQEAAEFGRRPSTLPIQALRGRDGRPLWSAGPLPLGFEAHGYSQVTWAEPRVIEPGSAPDLVVLHRSPFLAPNPTPTVPSPWGPTQQRLARVSGRTGRILWDIPLEEKPSHQQPGRRDEPPRIADLDGDGALDTAMIVRRPPQPGQSEFDLRVISLRDGASRWSQVVQYHGFINEPATVEIGEGAKGEPATVFVTQLPTTPNGNELIVQALDGRDGTVRWTWRSGVGEGDGKYYGGIDPINLDGRGKDSLCVTYSNLRHECRILLLGPDGRERGRRDLPPETGPRIRFPPVSDLIMDIDGDARDELMVWYDNVLYAWGRDLKEWWSRPAPQGWPIQRFLPSKPGHPCTLVLSPAMAVDGLSGQARWIDKSPTLGQTLLDPGEGTRRPLLISSRNSPTVSRCALPATPQGDYAPPIGSRVPPGLAVDDPRWTRPLPWTEPIVRTIGPRGFLALIALALVNVIVPVEILRLAARRRPWTLRLLMALPVSAAVPLTVFQTIEPLVPAQIGSQPVSSRLVFALGTLAGVPIVGFAIAVVGCLIRRRWRTLALLTGLTALATVAIAAAWLWADRRLMPAIEHYDRSSGYLAIVLGTYLAGALSLIGWVLRGMYRGIMRLGNHRSARWIDATPAPPTM